MSTSFLKADRISGYFEGTTCLTANQPAAIKKVIPPNMRGASMYSLVGLNGEGVYAEGGKMSSWKREGFNFPNAESEFSAATTSSIASVMLTNSLGVVIYIVSTKLYAKAFSVTAGGAITYGTAVTVNDADTGTMPNICRISDSTYAIAYADDGGSDYLCVRMGSVSGTTITQGDEVEMTAAAITKDQGIGICQPRDGVIAVGYSDANSYGAVIAATFDTITVDAAGTAVVATGTDAVTECDLCSHIEGYVTLVYADVSTGYLTANIGTVSAAAVVAFGGSEEALGAVAATNIRISSPRTNEMVITWLEDGDVAIIAGGVLAAAPTTFVQGSQVTITTTATVPRHAVLDETHVAVTWCDDAGADQAYIVRYTITWAATAAGTCVADGTYDEATEASVKSDLSICATTDGEVIVSYTATAASAHGNAVYGQFFDDNIIDIRASGASAAYSFFLVPVFEYVKTN